MQTAYISHTFGGKKHVEFQDGSRQSFTDKELAALMKDPDVKMLPTNEFLEQKMRPSHSEKNRTVELAFEALSKRNEQLESKNKDLEARIVALEKKLR